MSAPFLLLPVGWLAWAHHATHPEPLHLRTWLAFGYVTLFSQFIGFFTWYADLTMGGIARVGQVQLLQIFFTMAFSALFFGGQVSALTWIYAAAVIVTVIAGRKATARRACWSHTRDNRTFPYHRNRTSHTSKQSDQGISMNQTDLRTTPWQLSERARKLTSSAIREILKVTERPEVISFASGLPSPATFPVEEMRHASERILRDQLAAALQYSATEGYMPLREWVAERYSTNGVTIYPTQVLITTGSQQALDLLSKSWSIQAAACWSKRRPISAGCNPSRCSSRTTCRCRPTSTV